MKLQKPKFIFLSFAIIILVFGGINESIIQNKKLAARHRNI